MHAHVLRSLRSSNADLTRLVERGKKNERQQFSMFDIGRVPRSDLLKKSLEVIALCIAIREAELLQVEVENVKNTPIIYIVICYVSIEFIERKPSSTCRRLIRFLSL